MRTWIMQNALKRNKIKENESISGKTGMTGEYVKKHHGRRRERVGRGKGEEVERQE